MSGWPIHEYDPRPEWRRFRRASLVAAERIRREAVRIVEPIVVWLSRH